jgi:hypothetical protein
MNNPRKAKAPETQNHQLSKFKALAKEAEADPDPAAWEKRLKKIAKPPAKKAKRGGT